MNARDVNAVLDELIQTAQNQLFTEAVDAHRGDVVSALCGVPQVGPYTRDSVTSKKAAYENMPRSGSQRWRVLRAIAMQGGSGATREEISRMTGLDGDSVRPRVWELMQGGWVMASAVTRKTNDGNEAEVLKVTLKGMARA